MSEPKKLTPLEFHSAMHLHGCPPVFRAHIAALEQMATVKGALNYCVLANAERDAAIARAEAAEARVKVLEEELRWQPIETAPKDGTVILMTDGVVVSAGHWKGPDPQWVEWRPNWIVAHFVHSSPVINENITYWMPLPALSPPATEDAKP